MAEFEVKPGRYRRLRLELQIRVKIDLIERAILEDVEHIGNQCKSARSRVRALTELLHYVLLGRDLRRETVNMTFGYFRENVDVLSSVKI